MNEVEDGYPDRLGSLGLKTLWRKGARFQARKDILVNAGRQQLAGKEDYLRAWSSPFADEPEDEIGGSVIGRIEFYFGSYIQIESLSCTELWDGSVEVAFTCPAFLGNWQRHVVYALKEGVELAAKERARLNFFEQIKRLEAHNEIDAALDLLFDQIHARIKAETFRDIDALLAAVDVCSLSTNLLVGLLTATLPARKKLPSRARFFSVVESALKARGDWAPNLLVGLEN